MFSNDDEGYSIVPRRKRKRQTEDVVVGYVRIIILIIFETLENWDIMFSLRPTLLPGCCRVQWASQLISGTADRVPPWIQGDLVRCAGIVISVILFAYLGLNSEHALSSGAVAKPSGSLCRGAKAVCFRFGDSHCWNYTARYYNKTCRG